MVHNREMTIPSKTFAIGENIIHKSLQKCIQHERTLFIEYTFQNYCCEKLLNRAKLDNLHFTITTKISRLVVI